MDNEVKQLQGEKTKNKLLPDSILWWSALVIASIAFILWLLYVLSPSLLNSFWDFTGFQGKTLWDFLSLLIFPAILAGVAAMFRLIESQRAEQRDTLEKDRQQSQRKLDRERELDRQKEAALQTYLDQMKELLIRERLSKAKPEDEVSIVARTLTVATMQRLDGRRNTTLLRFLQDAKLNPSVFDFKEANLNNIDLGRAIISNIDFSAADLREANLEGADLKGAHLVETNLEGANLKGANLREANLKGAHLVETNLEGTDLWGADLMEAALWRANLEGASLGEANLEGASLVEANLRGATLEKTHLERVSLAGANLEGATLWRNYLGGAYYNDKTVWPEGFNYEQSGAKKWPE